MSGSKPVFVRLAYVGEECLSAVTLRCKGEEKDPLWTVDPPCHG